MLPQNALYSIIEDRLARDELTLPSMPKTAEQVRNATFDERCNLQQLARIIQHDPALSARLIKLANSAYLGGRNKAESVMQALTRIGMRRIRTLALALAMEQVFQPQNDIVKHYADEFWQCSQELAAAAVVITQYLQTRGLALRLHQDVALLSGMVSRLGVAPILRLADEHSDSFANPSFIRQTTDQLDCRIGERILNEWDFSENVIDVVRYYRSGRKGRLDDAVLVNYCDIVHLAALCTGHLSAARGTMSLADYQQLDIIDADDFWQRDDLQSSYRDIKAILD
ncbi:histidine kinase [Idiomarina tyrosinivorans]|uniref:Histidine kinase n=1 Tax=Idiomarina tyrosinivorans TaxID=1445662 RepID=A0A432ZSG6_9GAMM|nr:HDOD domain-containing protein [Idiomarina tyrosinivorans]RUO80781.1 histidine kinase [Idiomarina tyrosinivorans]